MKCCWYPFDFGWCR